MGSDMLANFHDVPRFVNLSHNPAALTFSTPAGCSKKTGVMHPVAVLLPVILLIATGYLLARIRLLGPQFIADMNKLGFYVALPAFILQSLAEVRVPAGTTLRLFLLLLGCTLAAGALAWGLSLLFRTRADARGSIIQASFRGNLAFAGLPIITYSLVGLPESERLAALGTALLVFAPLTACYNLLAVLCLQKIPHDSAKLRSLWGEIIRSILTNPLIIACLGGVALAVFGLRLPGPIDTTLKALGGIAMPVALLCIGGSFQVIRLEDRHRAIGIGVLVKLIALPLLAWWACDLLGVTGLEKRIVLIFAGVPTAATAFTMAKQMGGDEIVTSASIMLSTVMAAVTLLVILKISP
jgi:predicted permease